MEEQDPVQSDLDPTCNQAEIYELIKAYWKRRKQDQASKPSEGRQEKKKREGFFEVDKTKVKIAKDGTKKLPSSHRRTNIKKTSQRSPEYYQGRRGSPQTARSFHPLPRNQTHSSDSHESPRFHHFPKHFDLRSILPKKSSSQQNSDRYGNSKRCKSQALERSSSLEMEDAYKISKSKHRDQRYSSHCCSPRSCFGRNYDSFSSSESESYYHFPNHQSHRSRHHSRRLHSHRRSCSPYPDCKKSKHHHRSHKSKRATSRRPIDMSNEPHSSKSQPPVQRETFDHYDRRSHLGRSYDSKKESYSAQNYADYNKGHKRCRSPSFVRWSRSPSKDNVPEKNFDEELAREVKQQKTSSAKKHKFPVKEIWRSPTFERGSLNRYSGKKDAPREKLKGEARKDKPNKANCPVDEEYNKRMYEEFLKTMKRRESIEKWVASTDESNSCTGNPRILSRASSVAFENDPVCPTKSQDDASQESRVLIEKDKARLTESQKNSSKDSKSSMEKDPIMVTSNKTDQCGECEVPKITSVERGVSDEKCLCRDSVAPDVTFVEVEVSNKDQNEVSETPEVSFVEEKRVTNEKNQCEESEVPVVTFGEMKVSNKDQRGVSEDTEVTFIEERRIANEKNLCGESEDPDVSFVEMGVSNKDQCEKSEAPEVTFVEEKRFTNENVQRGESDAPEVIFVESGVRNEKNQLEEPSEASKHIFVEDKKVTNEDQFKKSEAPKVTSKERDLVSDTSLPKEQVSIQKDFQERKKIMPNTFFCSLCQIQLTSEVTWSTHIVGKRHIRKMQVQTVYEIAKGSLPVLGTPSITSDDVPRFAHPPLGKKRKLTKDIARLQSTIDEIRGPVAGLEYVHEIISPMDVDYYCSLCDSPCKAASIMPHLIGFKHQLRVVRELFPKYYELNKNQEDQVLKRKIRCKLLKYEEQHGRGSIKVFKEVDDPDTRPSYNQPGPSYRNPTLPYIKKEPNGDSKEQSSRDSCLDMSKGDFFCQLCDSHMNNQIMWEQHLRGKRHFENIKKVPGECISKLRSQKLPGVVSELERLIDKNASDELIVGLDYIRETRGPAGEMYNCFLCGACTTTYDIIEHLLLLKHRTKYLEQLNVEGKSKVITEIDSLNLGELSRDSLITYQCYKMVEDFGRGKVEVYQSKN